jgi:hypothetical protein
MITGIVQSQMMWSGEIAPQNLSFSKVSDTSYFNLLAENLKEVDENFASDSGQVSVTHFQNAATPSFGTNEYIISTTSSSAQGTLVYFNAHEWAMPQNWIECDVENTDASASGYDVVAIGFIKSESDYVVGAYDRLNNEIRCEVRVGGGAVDFYSAITPSPSIGSSFTIGLSLVDNFLCVFVDSGSGWEHVTDANIGASIDMRNPANMAGFYPGFFISDGSGGTTEWRFSNFKYGRHGGVGIRDQTLVTQVDGTPYRPTADTVMFTATIPDAAGFASLGVFTIDLSDYSYSLDAVLVFERSGYYYCDLNAHIIYYPNGDRRVVFATWATRDAALEIHHVLETTDDLLDGSYVVTGSAALALPTASTGTEGEYDPILHYNSNESRWEIAYSITERIDFAGSPFYAAAAQSSDLVTWTAIGDDDSNHGYEGTKILAAKGRIYILAGGATSVRVYDESMNYLGSPTAVLEGGSDTQPHPCIVPYNDKQILITFDDTKPTGIAEQFTWGNLLIYEADRYL